MKERGNPLLKKADRYLGIPIVRCLGLLTTRRKLPKFDKHDKVRFILLKTAAIGDTILTQAMVQEIKSNFPNSTIDYVCTSTNYAMAKLLPDIDNVFLFNIKKPVKGLLKLRKLLSYDFLIDFAPWTRINAVIAYYLSAKFKVGFKRKNMYRHYVYDICVEHSDDVHEIDNYRKLLKICGLVVHNYLPAFDFQKEELTNELEGLIRTKYCVFHLCPGGSKQYQRSWELNKWLELSQLIFEKFGVMIILTGGDEDKERVMQLALELQENGIPYKVIAGKANLCETGKVLQSAKFLVSVNTGIMHLGAALNIPVFALNGPTSSLRWGPLGEKSYSLQSGISCQPCISLGFESDCTNPKCMQQLSVKQVMQVINSQWARLLLNLEVKRGIKSNKIK